MECMKEIMTATRLFQNNRYTINIKDEQRSREKYNTKAPI